MKLYKLSDPTLRRSVRQFKVSPIFHILSTSAIPKPIKPENAKKI